MESGFSLAGLRADILEILSDEAVGADDRRRYREAEHLRRASLSCPGVSPRWSFYQPRHFSPIDRGRVLGLSLSVACEAALQTKVYLPLSSHGDN